MIKYLTFCILLLVAFAAQQAEFKGQLSRQYLTQQYHLADTDSNNKLNMNQFAEYVRANYVALPIGKDTIRGLIQSILQSFSTAFDHNEDGSVDLQEFIHLQRRTSFQQVVRNSMGEQLQIQAAKMPVKDLLNQRLWSGKYGRSALEKKFQDSDEDKNGFLTLQQYINGSVGVYIPWSYGKKLVNKFLSPFLASPFKKFDYHGDGLDVQQFIQLQRSFKKDEQYKQKQRKKNSQLL